MTGRVHRAAERRFAAWKNGGGETAEILCVPEGAGYDTFLWRISTARVAQSGPFSVFPGVRRSLTVIEGGAMRLTFGDELPLTVGPGIGPVGFPGDIPCHAELIGPALLDLNVMVRAPYALQVTPADHGAPPVSHAVARYLFALTALSTPELARHDLCEMAPDAPVPPTPGAMLIDIIGAETDARAAAVDGPALS